MDKIHLVVITDLGYTYVKISTHEAYTNVVISAAEKPLNALMMARQALVDLTSQVDEMILKEWKK